MAGSKTDYASDLFLTHLDTGAQIAADNYYIAFYTVAPTEATEGTGAAATNEVADANYSRYDLSGAVAGLWTIGDATVGSGRELSNTSEIALYTADSGHSIVAWGIVDSASGAGNLLYWCDDPALTVNAADDVKFGSGAIKIVED